MRRLLLVLPLLLVSCDLFRETPEDDTDSPSVVITYPSEDDIIEENIVIKASVSDENPIREVQFFIDGDSVQTDRTFPYEHLWDISYHADGRKHSIFARATDRDGNTGQSLVVNVRVSNSAAAVPRLVAPASAAGFEASDIRFQWHSYPDAEEYELAVSRSPDFIPNVLEWSGADTVYQAELSEAGAYHWRVRALNAAGRPSRWSEPRMFTIIELSMFESSEGLVAYYPLNGNAVDESPNGHHGVVHGAVPCEDRLGVPRCAYQFNGDSYISLGAVFDDLQVPFTVSLWVFCRQYPLWFIESDCVTRQGFTAYYGFWFKVFDDGRLEISLGDGNCAGYQCRRSKYSYETIPLDRWVHVAASVRNAFDMKLFIDGREVEGYYDGEGSVGEMVHNAWPAVLAGYSQNGCRMDEVRLHSRSIGY